MATKEINIYSCNCFFNICLLSYSKNDDFKQLSHRIRNYCDKKYEKQKRNASCPCSNCTPTYKLKNNWVLKEVNMNLISLTSMSYVKTIFLTFLRTFLFASMKRKK